MRNGSATPAPLLGPSDGKMRPLSDRLEDFARDHPNEAYLIMEEWEAAQFLMTLFTVIMQSATDMTKSPSRRRTMRQTAFTWRKAAKDGAALAYCVANFNGDDIEYAKVPLAFAEAIQ